MKSKFLLASTAVLGLAAVAQPAWAQEAPEAGPSSEECETDPSLPGCTNADGSTTEEGAIVVTGSRIRRDEFSTAEPITVITNQEITQAGFNSTADVLQSTEVTQGTAQINNYFAGFVTNGGTGANTVGLRGLGPERTLLLLNGHRLAPAGTRGSVGSVDLNVLPSALIERIEVLKAGASSIYGSDAVAGVINIVTDTTVDGLTFSSQVNVPEAGAGVSTRVSAVLGYNADRFKFAGSVEYYDRKSLRLSDRDFLNCPTDFRRLNGGEPGTGDFIDPLTGAPKCFPLDNGGVTINTLGIPNRVGQPALGVPPGLTVFNRFRPNPSVTTGLPGFEGVGGTGVNVNVRDTFDPQSQREDLVTPAKIATGFLQASYETGFLGNGELYVELLANQRKSRSTLYRQLSLDYPRGSPLLPANIRDGLFLNPTPTSNGQQVAARAFIGYGNTATRQEVDFVKIGGGIRGDFFFDDWRYDFYASRSYSDGTYENETFLTDRIANSFDVVQNANGTFSCRSSAPGCVAAPFLTPAVISGNLPQNYRDYIVDNVVGTTKFRESIATFIVDGPFLTLPGGEAQVALGAEYRKSRINDTPPEDSQRGNLFNLTSATPTRGSDSVWEVFGELDLPILSDQPFAYRLNVNGSLRYTEYDSYGGDETYKIALEYEPIRGLAFRGSYGTSFRAPALFEQFLGGTTGFLGSAADPCDGFGDPGTLPVVVANCRAEGLPDDFVQRSGITVINAGGAASGLEAETSKNYSAGVVIRPRLGGSFGDLSLALDYFDITVDNGVSRIGGTAILNRCFNDPDFRAGGGFCRLVTRDANFNVTVNDNFINIATDVVRGFEFNGRYARELGPGRIILNALVTKFEEQSNKLFPEDPLDDANGIITQPEWTGSFNANYAWKGWNFRYGLDWVQGDNTKTYAFVDEDPATSIFDLEVDDYFLHQASIQYTLEDKYEFTFGVRNLLDRDPPRISSGVFNLVGNAPLYSGYDYVGRTFFVGVSGKF